MSAQNDPPSPPKGTASRGKRGRPRGSGRGRGRGRGGGAGKGIEVEVLVVQVKEEPPSPLPPPPKEPKVPDFEFFVILLGDFSQLKLPSGFAEAMSEDRPDQFWLWESSPSQEF